MHGRPRAPALPPPQQAAHARQGLASLLARAPDAQHGGGRSLRRHAQRGAGFSMQAPQRGAPGANHVPGCIAQVHTDLWARCCKLGNHGLNARGEPGWEFARYTLRTRGGVQHAFFFGRGAGAAGRQDRHGGYHHAARERY